MRPEVDDGVREGLCSTDRAALRGDAAEEGANGPVSGGLDVAHVGQHGAAALLPQEGADQLRAPVVGRHLSGKTSF